MMLWVAADTHPNTNVSLEVLKLLISALLTGSVALLGAWVGFGFANRGRKHDILYKESYKGFENITTYAFGVVDMVKDFQLYLSINIQDENSKGVYDFVKNASDRMTKLHESRPNRSSAVLLSESTKKYFNALLSCHDASIVLFLNILYEDSKTPRNEDPAKLNEFIKNLRDVFKGMEEMAESVIASAFKDIDLPRK